MLIVFLSSEKIIHFEFFNRERNRRRGYTSYNSEKFIKTLDEFIDKVKFGNKIIFHYDNVSIHKNQQVLNHLKNHKITRSPHPPYSPDISPCDYFLFSKERESCY